MNNFWRANVWRSSLAFVLAVGLCLIAQADFQGSPDPFTLPSAQVHPLPVRLQQWQVDPEIGDYFEQVETSPLGYLIWSQFPVTVAIAAPPPNITTSEAQRWQRWQEAVNQAIKEWQAYFPIEIIDEAEAAAIVIERAYPPLGVTFDPETGQTTRPRARSAQTRYELNLTATQPPQWQQHMTIQIAPGRSYESALGTARHEIGHALGIWGHSPEPTDALYFSQVRDTALISSRDINTLKKIYQQPTQLGWPLVAPSIPQD